MEAGLDKGRSSLSRGHAPHGCMQRMWMMPGPAVRFKHLMRDIQRVHAHSPANKVQELEHIT